MRSDLAEKWERVHKSLEEYEAKYPERMEAAERWFKEGEAEANANSGRLTDIHPSDIRFISTNDDFRTAVENYEIAGSLSAIRFRNKEAKGIYDDAFAKAQAAMKAVAEDRRCTYEDVLAAVRDEARC